MYTGKKIFSIQSNMTFQDLIEGFKSQNVPQSLSYSSITITLTITFLLGVIIFFTYKKNYNSISYSHTFSSSLIILAMITSTIILTISSNLVLSLGMVGALSIVRFRSAIKDPMDIVYLFWSISLGLMTGAQLFNVAVIGSLIISLTIFFLMRFNNQLDIFLLVIHYDELSENKVLELLSKYDYTLKSKHSDQQQMELTVELKLVTINTDVVNKMKNIENVHDVSLVSYNGEFIE